MESCSNSPPPKGSYRKPNNIEYYEYFTPECTELEDCELHLVDWYVCNVKDKKLDELIEGRGHPILRIPGSVTGLLQVNDTKAHGPYSKNYKDREEHDALEALMSGSSVPPADKNIMMQRAHAAWEDLDHVSISRGFVECGIAGNLFGGDDIYLNGDVRPLWEKQPWTRDVRQYKKRSLHKSRTGL